VVTSIRDDEAAVTSIHDDETVTVVAPRRGGDRRGRRFATTRDGRRVTTAASRRF
jgi:hypothetical protein